MKKGYYYNFFKIDYADSVIKALRIVEKLIAKKDKEKLCQKVMATRS